MTSLWADPAGYGWDHMGGFGWGMMIFGWIFGIVLLVVLVWALVQATGSGARRSSPASDAERILAERFARGEIDEEEYRRRLAALRS